MPGPAGTLRSTKPADSPATRNIAASAKEVTLQKRHGATEADAIKSAPITVPESGADGIAGA